MNDTIQTEDDLGLEFCSRQQVVVEAASGCRIRDDAGNLLLDMTAGWGVTSLGHCHPVVVDALNDQASRVMQNPNSGFTYSPARARLLKALTPLLPGSLCKSYFVNSGAEANDAAIKIARLHTGRSRIVSTLRAFHGRTQETSAVSVGPGNGAAYLADSSRVTFVHHGVAEEALPAIDSSVAALIVEPVQGEGGIRLPGPAYLQRVAELCRHHGALLIVDEVQTGFCRTGKFFASEHAGADFQPDIMTFGKGIAGGFPFAGFAVTRAVAASVGHGDHGGTYAGNPLGCAVAAAVINYLVEYRIASAVREKGEYLARELDLAGQDFPALITEVRALGLMAAVQFNSDDTMTRVCDAALAEGLIVTPTRDSVIRFLPSLLVTPGELQEAIRKFRAALLAVAQMGCDRLPGSASTITR